MNVPPAPQTRWLDVTRVIAPAMPVWPGDPPVEEEPLGRIAEGSGSNVTRFLLGSHTGTHIDPPLHTEPGGRSADLLDLDTLCGPCFLLNLSAASGHIAAADLVAAGAAGSRRILIRTRNSDRDADVFHEDFTALTLDAAEWLVANGVRLVGVDGPSVEAFGSEGLPVHHTILGAGIVAVEGLDLCNVPAGPYEMVCAPLKWRGADGAPARVLLRAM